MSGPPFFIVGSARSGTTLLRVILNAHSRVAVPPESRFITELHSGDRVQVDRFLEALERHDRFRLWELPIDAVRAEIGAVSTARYADAIAAVHSAWARARGKDRWGDKTPRYVVQMDFLRGLFPNARFVHLIRDGRNVALSYADVPFGPTTVSRAAALWGERVGAGIRSGRAMPPGSYLELRYEDLVEDTPGEIRSLCDFVEIDFEPGMIDYTESARGTLLSRAAHYNPHVGHKPTPGVRAWENEMPARHVEIFEAVAGDVLSELGYERRFPNPGTLASLTGRLGRFGLPIARLRTGHAAR